LPRRPRDRIKRPRRIRAHDVRVRRVRRPGDRRLKCSGGGGNEFAYTTRGFVNKFGWLGIVRLGIAGVVSDAPAQFAVNGGFTMSAKLFNIRVHS
ncbi:hypothetical protein, partial [Brucella anthropi]|uniref:hypothetical protein n=1 Tax=Brucella anthropi TaxID=529 RepID=UPI001AEBC0DA